MKIVIINGSPRKGNTLTAIEAFASGAEEANEVEVLHADKLNISPCKGCGACQCSKGCVAKDDSTAVADKLVAADMIVFASPIYWWGVTAQLKTVIDKSYCRAALLKGKKIGLILCAGAPTDDEEFGMVRKEFECIAEYMEWDFRFFRSYYTYEAKDLAGNTAALEELKALGASLN